MHATHRHTLWRQIFGWEPLANWVASLLLSITAANPLLPSPAAHLIPIVQHHQPSSSSSTSPFLMALYVQAAVQANSLQAAQQQKHGRQSAFAHAAVDLNEDDEYLKQQQPQVTPAEARNQYRRPARLAGRLAQLRRPPRPVEVRC